MLNYNIIFLNCQDLMKRKSKSSYPRIADRTAFFIDSLNGKSIRLRLCREGRQSIQSQTKTDH